MRDILSHTRLPTDPRERAALKRRLNLIAVIAVVDTVLLGFLLYASVSDHENAVHVLGPIHGAGFLVLTYLCMDGALHDRWGSWFPLIVVLTGGPIGSLIGDRIVRRRLAAS